jgi:glycosyltransferase involved in cell wall biosynthesis
VPALAKALGRLLEDSALRHSLSERARARALAEFTIDAMTDAYERVYTAARGAGLPQPRSV